MALAVASVSLALLTAWAFLSTSPMFAVTRAEVLGVRHLSRLEVLSAGGLGAHSNLLALPVGRLEQRIRRLGWVRRVRVSRRPPHTVRIEIQERTPRCLVLAEGRLYYLDSGLKSFASALGEAPPDLPVITGLKAADLANPDDEMKDLLAGARRLLDQLPRADLGPADRSAKSTSTGCGGSAWCGTICRPWCAWGSGTSAPAWPPCNG
jgi:cell division protein FtsQ